MPRGHSISATLCCFWLAAGGIALAHVGFESETEARIYADRMELCFRCTPAFAWRMMGNEAPPPGAEEIAKPVIERLAAGWVEVSSAGEALAPRSARCVFEVDGHVAVLFHFPPAVGNPLGFHLTFFDRLGPLDTSILRVYDQSAAPFDRSIEPFATAELVGSAPRHEVWPGGPPAPAETGPPPPRAADPWRIVGILSAAGLAAALGAALWKRREAGPPQPG